MEAWKAVDQAPDEPSRWDAPLRELSEACRGENVPKSHVAFVGTAILAKAADPSVDMRSVKARDTAPGAYSARGIVSILVRYARDIGIDLGVNRGEPLNNQPYFHLDRAEREPPSSVSGPGKKVWALVQNLIDAIEAAPHGEAASALRAFIRVRRQYYEHVADAPAPLALTPPALTLIIERFVSEKSERGGRAQAVVAGLLRAAVGSDRVVTHSIHDPSRGVPGDVAVRSKDGEGFARAYEVRDKPVSMHDVEVLCTELHQAGVLAAGIVAVALGQEKLEASEVEKRSQRQGIAISVFDSWAGLVAQCVHWADATPEATVRAAIAEIRGALMTVGVANATIARWDQLTASA
jgi:hypothetical protein